MSSIPLRLSSIFALALSLLLSTGVSLSSNSEVASRPAPPSDHVVLVSIDGLRPDAIAKYNATTLQRLAREGAVAEDAQTITPSKTLPSHASMLTGVWPEVHGVTWNSDETEELGYVNVPTIFEIAKQHGFTTAAFFSKSKFHHLQKPGTLDYSQAPSGTNWMATKTVADVQQYLKFKRPNLLFVHIGEPDYVGHTTGWMSFPYGWAVRHADSAVKLLLAAAEEAYGAGNYTFIVTADHGGHGRSHGSDDARDMTIPWIAWGKGVERDAVPTNVNTTDTAATVLWLLGIPVPESWSGSPVASAFAPEPALRAMMR